MDVVKVAIVGSSGVGKSAIVSQYVNEKFFAGENIPTTDECYIIQRDFEGKTYELEINDTAGSDEHASLREMGISNAEAFVVVYSTTNMDSFADAKKFVQTIHEIKKTKPLPVVLVGNKIDVEEGQREVMYSDGDDLARELDVVFLEVTAKDGKLVDGMFKELMRQVEQMRVSKVKSSHSVAAKKTCCIVL